MLEILNRHEEQQKELQTDIVLLVGTTIGIRTSYLSYFYT